MARKKYLTGIDIGGTKCAVILGNSDAEIVERISFATETNKGPEYTIKRIIHFINELLEKNKLISSDIKAIGISCGGPLDSKKGIVMSPPNLPGWDNIPIVEIIEKQFKVKTGIQNDANACALAEWKWGAGKGYQNLVFLTFGTGLGSGIILNNQLYSGTNDNAGEVGHIRLAPDGPIGYNKAGSFEGFCSGGGIAQLAKSKAREYLDKGKKVAFCSSLSQIDSIDVKRISEAAEKGDPLAIEIFGISGMYLGMGLSIIIDILNPEVIIIGSIFLRCEELLRPAMEEVINKEALKEAAQVCTIVPAGLGESIGDYASLGVALNVLADFDK